MTSFENEYDNDINAASLQRKTGCNDLSLVTSLKTCVSTTQQDVAELGTLLPNLSHLQLDGSHVSSLRDLGNQLHHLSVLKLSNCRLSDIDGMDSFSALTELSLSWNPIQDISPLSMHPALQSLDLSCTEVADVDSIDFLGDIPNLTSLNLKNTPLSAHQFYRNIISSRCKMLKFLDGIIIKEAERTKIPSEQELLVSEVLFARSRQTRMRGPIDILVLDGSVDEDDVTTIQPNSPSFLTRIQINASNYRKPQSPLQNSLRKFDSNSQSPSPPSSLKQSLIVNRSSRPQTARPSTSSATFRPAVPLLDLTAPVIEPEIAVPLTSTAALSRSNSRGSFTARPQSARPCTPSSSTSSFTFSAQNLLSSLSMMTNGNKSDAVIDTSASSSLTYETGGVVCGNFTLALKARRKRFGSNATNMTASSDSNSQESSTDHDKSEHDPVSGSPSVQSFYSDKDSKINSRPPSGMFEISDSYSHGIDIASTTPTVRRARTKTADLSSRRVSVDRVK